MKYLRELVRSKIRELGHDSAADFFRVQKQLIQQWEKGSKPISLSAVERVFSPDEVLKAFGQIHNIEWEGKQLALLLPFYKSNTPQTGIAILSLLDRTKMAVITKFNDAFIVHSRNSIATRFVESMIPWGLWIDDDMVPPMGNAATFAQYTGFKFPPQFLAMNAIKRLMSHNLSLVGGLYFGRNVDSHPMYCEGLSDPKEGRFAHGAPYDLVKPTDWVATGCLLMSREVLLAIMRKFPELAPQTGKESFHFFSNSETDLTEATRLALGILNDSSVSEQSRIEEVSRMLLQAREDAMLHNRLQQGEDITFCRRATAAGHRPHVDFGCVCGHIGPYVYGPKGSNPQEP